MPTGPTVSDANYLKIFSRFKHLNFLPVSHTERIGPNQIQMGLKNNVYQTVALTRWVVVYPGRDKQKVDKFLEFMRSDSQRILSGLEQPMTYALPDTRTGTYLAKLREIAQKGPNMIVVVIPSEKGDTYASIKASVNMGKASCKRIRIRCVPTFCGY